MVAAVRVKALMSWGVKAVAREAGGEPWGLATVQGSLGPVGFKGVKPGKMWEERMKFDQLDYWTLGLSQVGVFGLGIVILSDKMSRHDRTHKNLDSTKQN